MFISFVVPRVYLYFYIIATFVHALMAFILLSHASSKKKNNNQGNQSCILHLEVFNDLLLDVPILGYIISN